MQKADILICGGGIVGLTLAGALAQRGFGSILIIEKENKPGMHASGRNSGVLHSGIYYSSDSLKAKFCLKGNLLMKQYCKDKGLPLLETGKVIAAKNKDEVKSLHELYDRAVKNGAHVELITEKRLSEIEPHAKTCEIALHSRDTAVVDPKAVLQSLNNDLASSKKVNILFNTEFKHLKAENTAITTSGEIGFDTFINAAGAYSDKVAHVFGIALKYKFIPFKGIYKKLRPEKNYLVNGNIYPVPDIRNPFLGIHFTRNINGDVYLGPTAIPAFGRENYGIVSGMDSEAFDIAARESLLFFVNPKFRDVAISEPKKYIFRCFYEDAKKLVSALNPEDIIPADKVGIRPQLVDWETKELIMDFLIQPKGNSIHILNAISPAFTSSMAFAEFIIEEYVYGNTIRGKNSSI
jgi:L-2-hydroxyglutarate oxidase LhgO